MKRLGMIALIFLLFGAAVPAVSASSLSKGGGTYYHPYPTNVQQGDLVFGYSPDLSIMPGHWTHVGIIAWYDYSVGDWIVIEATPKNGVSLITLRNFLSRDPEIAIKRVNTDSTTKYYAVYFAYSMLGKPYNYNYLAKPQVFDSAYYCSELVWAAYMWASNGLINLDTNPGWSWTYGYAVAPQEVYDSPWTYLIYYHKA
ncbi:YiiX/YebB-like N1pC/P60 family cysteine hydrolase [Thermococcus zilligii]|uniref:YiiX/YebB-like N1pC/P60 family cysteine hydrolase n=1 Tax=Thermococcus zilligii TaxID=54076 RepID=UPI00029A59C0|nr:YiiX/YebB-like N1pC/P60 family cysteine hydrolase [Thermococcus zilligii]